MTAFLETPRQQQQN